MDHRVALPNCPVVIGELQVNLQALVERRPVMIHPQRAVDPGLEEAIGIRGPFHVIDEVVPDVFHERTNVRAVGELVSNGVGDNNRSALAAECEETARPNEDLEIRLARLISRVVEIEDCCPGTRCEVVWKQDRVRPPLFPALNAVCDQECDIVAFIGAAAGDVVIPWFRVQT